MLERIKKVLSLDLKKKNREESLIRTVHGSKFQTGGAENGKARLENVGQAAGWKTKLKFGMRCVPVLSQSRREDDLPLRRDLGRDAAVRSRCVLTTALVATSTDQTAA